LFLFIFESIGTQELILIGIVALIFLGPRRMPEMARKLGKLMADFRNTTSEFKATWEREVSFEHEAHALRTGDLPSEPVARTQDISAPEVRAIDPEEVRSMIPEPTASEPSQPEIHKEETDDKRDWL
jgi:sec-independent protein translocase protein TatB